MHIVWKKIVLLHPQNDASVAQLVEHLTLNQGVQGSTPCGSTRTEFLTDCQSGIFVKSHSYVTGNRKKVFGAWRFQGRGL